MNKKDPCSAPTISLVIGTNTPFIPRALIFEAVLLHPTVPPTRTLQRNPGRTIILRLGGILQLVQNVHIFRSQRPEQRRLDLPLVFSIKFPKPSTVESRILDSDFADQVRVSSDLLQKFLLHVFLSFQK